MNRAQTFHETLIPLLVEAIGARTYCEMGTGNGETIFKVKCAKRVGVDIQVLPGIWPKDLHFYNMTTHDFITQFAAEEAPFDLVFIDSDHAAEAVRADFLGIIDYVSPEGLVLLHDTNAATLADTDPGLCGDAWRAARQISVDYEAVTLPFHPGLTIVRKRDKWEPQE